MKSEEEITESQTGGDGDVVVEAALEAEPDAASLSAALDKAKAEAQDNWERCLRTAAELENVRKRAARDVENANRFAIERFAKELLTVRDSMEMALAATADQADLKAHVEGTQMTLRTLDAVLEKFGVTPIDPQGKPFDPQLHEAMATREEPGVEPGTVVEVVQKGFELNGRLLRAARVFVAQ